jgi:predicted nucleic acid-binding protein
VKLFIDTWGGLTLRDRHETKHLEVADYYHDFRTQGGDVYTTDYVLDETFTLLFKRLPFAQAQEALEMLDQAVVANYLNLEWITPERFSQTKDLRLRIQDKPQISFTDLSSMVVMEELGISLILTGDAHFTHVGFSFQLVP